MSICRNVGPPRYQRRPAARFRYARLLRYGFREWPLLSIVLAITACGSAIAALQPWPLKLLVDYALGGAQDSPDAGRLLWSFLRDMAPLALIVLAATASLLLFAINAALDAGLSWVWALAGQRMVYDLAADLFARLQRLSLIFHNRRTVGDSLNRITGDTSCINNVISGLLIAPTQHASTIAVVGGVAWGLDPELTSILLLVSPVLGVAALFFGSRLKRNSREKSEVRSRMMAVVQQTVGAMPLVQAFAAEERNRHHFRRLSCNAVTASQQSVLLGQGSSLVNGLANTGAMAVVLYIGGERVMSGALSVGTLLVFLAYVQLLQGAFRGLVRTFLHLKIAEAQIDRILEIFDADEEVKEAPNAVPLPRSTAGQPSHLRFEHVTFGYKPGIPVLRSVDLEVEPGETIGLVGSTGAGKSTLISLIPRLFDPWQGRIVLDSFDVRALTLSSLRGQLGVVLQEPFLFPTSVADNISYGRPGAGRHAIEAAAKAANAHHFIERLPSGYDTILGEGGITLSVGERQRLAIARALLKDPPILICDEPTSALDVETEMLVLAALDRLMKNRTTLIIAHRLSTIRKADRIVVLNKGRIREIGTHHELLASHGLYHEFHALQVAGGVRGVLP